MDIKNNKPKKKGFTLTELIVVIAIIAILAAVLIPTITGYIEKARVSNDKTKAEGYNDILELNQISNSISKDPIEINTKADLEELLRLEDESLELDFTTSSKELYLWYDKDKEQIVADTYENIMNASKEKYGQLATGSTRTCASEFFLGYFYLNSDTELGKAIDLILTLRTMTTEEVAALEQNDIEKNKLQIQINDKINDIDEKYEEAVNGITKFLDGGMFVFKTYTITFDWSDTGVTIDINLDETLKPDIEYTVTFKDSDENETVLKDKPVNIYINEFGASSIDFGFRVWVEAANYWTTKWKMMEDIKKAFDENGIEIPFNQVDVNINPELPLSVNAKVQKF